MIENIQEVTVYGLLDWLERHYKISVEENDYLHFGGNIGFTTLHNDIKSIEKSQDDMWIVLNNVGVMNAHAPVHIIEDFLTRMGTGDTVVADFMDIFNHKVVENIYKMRKLFYPHYAAQEYKSLDLGRSLPECLRDAMKDRTIAIKVDKSLPRKIQNTKPIGIGDRLTRGILGQTCRMNDKVMYTLYCRDFDSYKVACEKHPDPAMCKVRMNPAKLGTESVTLGRATL